jgi:hypothetical protein
MPAIAKTANGRIISRVASHDDASPGQYLSVPGGFDRITGKRTREDGRVEYTLANQSPIAIHPSNSVELAILTD